MKNKNIFMEKNEIPVYISPMEYELIFVPKMEPNLLLYSTMVYDMGLRASNLLNLTYGDLSFASAGYIRISKNHDMNSRITLSVGVQSMLLTGFIGKHSNDEYLFAMETGRRWTVSMISKAYAGLSKETRSLINESSLFYSWCRNYAEYTFGNGNKAKARNMVSSLMEKGSVMNVI